MADSRETSGSLSQGVKLVAAIAAIVVGIFLLVGSTNDIVADALFVGTIALVSGIYLWSGVTSGQSKVIALVLLLVAAYAFIQGFGLFDLTIIRRLGGIFAVVSGVVMVIPFIVSLVKKNGAKAPAEL